MRKELLQDREQLCIVVLDKRRDGAGDVYSFAFYPGEGAQILRILGNFASNPELSLTWFDAAQLSIKVREFTGQLRMEFDDE